MGGVDLHDQQVSRYHISIRSKKWWWPIFAWSLNSALVNSHFFYRDIMGGTIDLLTFSRIVTNALPMHVRNAKHYCTLSASSCTMDSRKGTISECKEAVIAIKKNKADPIKAVEMQYEGQVHDKGEKSKMTGMFWKRSSS